MTLEEAKKLKPGDRVLVEATIDIVPITKSIFTTESDIAFKTDTHDNMLSFSFCAAKAIREKIAPPRRKFKAGDVVLSQGGVIMLVRCNEEESPLAQLVDMWGDYNSQEINDNTWDELTLVCAVENREDRKEEA